MKDLCLVCSSSLPPLRSSSSGSVIFTNCCQRPICPSCITSNPRLARYDPCLACLVGVGVLTSAPGSHVNLTDEDTFILGDDDDDDDDDDGSVAKTESQPETTTGSIKVDQDPHLANESPPLSSEKSSSVPYKYYLNRSDTLQGLSLRFGVDAHQICKLNNLPSSILRTTPHLLHTRAFLLLPPSAKPHSSLLPCTSEDKDLVRERAENKLQTLTKEVDFRIAKAYVALADDEEEQEIYAVKHKEVSSMSGTLTHASLSRGLEALAIGSYLDDLEWEAEELRAGRGIGIQKFPFADFGQQQPRDVPNSKEIIILDRSCRHHWWPWRTS